MCFNTCNVEMKILVSIKSYKIRGITLLPFSLFRAATSVSRANDFDSNACVLDSNACVFVCSVLT